MAEQAARAGYPITDEIRAAMVSVCAQTLLGRDKDGRQIGVTRRDRDRAARTLAMFDKINVERERANRTTTNVDVPVTAEQLAAMTDEELDAFHRSLSKLAGD